MTLFLSTFCNKIDKKGRISIPASFRNTLISQEFAGIVAYASFVNPCIEACGMERIEKISDSIDDLDPFSLERDAFAAAILGGAIKLSFDAEGRVMLPDNLVEMAGIKESAIFVGKGQTFEIWEPKAFELYMENARKIAWESRSSLRISKKDGA